MTTRTFGVGRIAGLLLFLLGLTGAGPALAVELRRGQEVVIAEDEVVSDDLVANGDTVKVLGRVEGDVVASGRLIVVEGVVEGDLMAAAQAVVIAGEVGDDVRMAGMTLKVEEGAVIGDDLLAAGFSFESEAESRVRGWTSFTGYQSRVAGHHERDLLASLVGLRLEGRVDGDIDATVQSEAAPAWWLGFMQSPVPLPTVQPGLVIEDEARIGGDLRYTSKAEADIAPSAGVAGEITHETPVEEIVEKPTPAGRFWQAVRKFCALLIIGVLLMWLLPERTRALVGGLVARPLGSLGWGLLALVAVAAAVPIVLAIALFLTVLLAWLGLGSLAVLIAVLGLLVEIALVFGLWIALAFVAPVIVALALGGWLQVRLPFGGDKAWQSLALGLLALVLIDAIPFLGPLAVAIVCLMALGAAASSSRHKEAATAW